MPITVTPNPKTLSWSNFSGVDSLPDEDAHIDIAFNVPNRPFRKVDGLYMMAESFPLGVSPVAKVVKKATKTDALLSHEQGHYNIGILAGHAMARDFAALQASTPKELAQLINDAFDLHRLTRMKAVQEKYDEDTEHSKNKGEQKRWDDLIKQCLTRVPTCDSLDKLPL
jgi:hypothetical protein